MKCPAWSPIEIARTPSLWLRRRRLFAAANSQFVFFFPAAMPKLEEKKMGR
jgi:hypothetical protein